MPPISRSLRLLLLSGLVLITSGGLAALVQYQAEQRLLAEAAEAGSGQARLYANSLLNLIDRYRALPAVLALDSRFRDALAQPVTPPIQQQLNQRLEQINQAAGSSILELMDHRGEVQAASNWREPTSFVGHNYSFRPYFQQARERGTGRFYGVGVVTGVPGYFLARAIQDQGRFLGTIVVKLEFPELEQSWRQRDEVILVSDGRGIVFIANQSGWRYRTLQALTAEDRKALAANRQYDRQPLRPLPRQILQDLAPNQQLTRVADAEIPTQEWLWTTLPLPSEPGWSIHLLQDSRSLHADARLAGLAAAGIWLTLVFAWLFLQQRWRLARERQRSRDELEQLVAARTRELQTAQDGLIQAAKLAALGQMSAALAHELNQPLTAQRMHLASLGMLLDQGRLDEARQGVQRLEHLQERMAALTGHLKTYARKTPAGLHERVDLFPVIQHALELLNARIRSEQVDVQLDLGQPAWVHGDAIRLEQVLVNLLRNALDAMSGQSRPVLSIGLHCVQGQWQLCVCDTGSGIAAEHLSQIFDPFFTTKPVGEGLGLGLAVSFAIVHEYGGVLRAENLDRGCCFTLSLPAAEEETAP